MSPAPSVGDGLPLDATLPPGGWMNELLRDTFAPVIPVFEVLTRMGDGPVLIAAAILLYWFGAADSRRKRAWVLAVGTVAFALAAGTKGVIAAPRPDLVFAPEYYGGYSFPSAHAMGAAAFYGAVAVSMHLGERKWRYLAAGAIIVVVSTSRVVLGVHYLADVVVGMLLGLGIVVLGLRWRGYDPGPLFAFAVVIATAAFVLGSREYTTLTIGAGLGGAVGWYLVWGRPTTDSGSAVLVSGSGVLAGLGLFFWLVPAVTIPTVALAGVTVFDRAVLEVGVYAVLMVVLLAIPVVARHIEDVPTVVRLQDVLPFRDRHLDIEQLVPPEES